MDQENPVAAQGRTLLQSNPISLCNQQPSDLYCLESLRVYHAREPIGRCETHEHPEVQIMITFPRACYDAFWETDLGQRRQQRFLGGGVNVIPAGQRHGFDWQQEDRLLSLYLAPSFVARLEEELSTKRATRHEIREQWGATNVLLQQLGQDLWDEFYHEAVPNALYLESVATVLLSHLLRPVSSLTSSRTGTGGLSPRKLKRILEFIRDCCHHDLSLERMATEVQLDRHHFSHAFKESLSVSPYEYVLRCRIERACALLQTCPDQAITHIALAVGFHDAAQFSRHFKRIVGCTPREYRDRP